MPPGDVEALAQAVRPGRTKLVWAETPGNPTWEVTDIAAAAGIAHGAGARLAVDSTAATPVLTRPIAHGADIVMHSATKYLNGHADVLAGVLVTARDDEPWRRVRALRHDGGAVLGPFEAWLLLRGMRTLFLRVRACSRSAQTLAEHFERHPKVAHVLYPGLAGHPGHEVAARQMEGGFGGMLSLRVAGGAPAALEVCGRTKVFKRATSLGGVESLIEHRASIEGPDSAVPDDLVRLAEERTHVAHLEHEPLDHGEARPEVGWEEPPGLLREIHQDRARFEQRDRRVIRNVEVDDRRNLAVRADGRELGLELLALADVDGEDAVRQSKLLEHDRDLAPVGR